MRSLTRRLSAILSVTLALAILPVQSLAIPTAVAATSTIAPASIPSVDLKCVTFVTDTIAFAAGAGGTIIKTTNGGDNWTPLATGTTIADFRGIAFWSATSGIAVTYDRKVYGTSNGGSTWSLVNADMTQYAQGTPAIGMSAVAALPANPGVAFLAGGDPNPIDDTQEPATVWRSATSGANWGQKPILEDIRHPEILGAEITLVGEGEFLGIDFIDAQRGWAVGDDLYSADATAPVYATTNGGINWTQQSFGLPLRLTGVSFASATAGAIVSDESRVFRTTNGGSTWVEGTSPVTSSLSGVALLDASNGWAAGASGTLLRTTNGGASWVSGTSPTFQDLYAINFSGTHGIAVGKFGTVVITDDGVNWRVPNPDTTGPTMTSLSSSTHPVEATWYRSGSATVSWTATDSSGVTGYSYVFDTSPGTVPDTISEGASTTTSTTLTSGLRYFHVRAVDAFGNWGETTHRAIKVDTAPPSTGDNALAAYAAATVITLTPTDALSGVANTYFVLDGVPGTGTSVGVSTEGVHALDYASVDVAGNREATTTVSFTVDMSGPSMTTITSSTHSSPDAWYSSNDPAFTWTATDAYSTVAGYSYSLDTSPATTPDTFSEGSAVSKSYTNVVDGVRYFHIRAVDSLGNWGAATHRAIRVDTTPPSTTDNHLPAYTGTAVIALTPTDAHAGVANTYYSLDGVPGTGTTVFVPAEGAHVLEYASVDAVGNRETTVTVDFRIDLTGPSLTSLTSSTHPSSSTWYSHKDPAFAWSATDPGGVAGYSYLLDEVSSTVPPETNLGSAEATSLANITDGTWYFHIRAVDSGGNWSGASVLPVNIDTTVPSTTDNAVSTYTSTAVITLTPTDASSGVANTHFVLDDVPGTGTTVLAYTEGPHKLDYASVDAAGNREGTTTVGFLVDSTGPSMTTPTSTTHSLQDAWYRSNDPAFAWTATDAYSTVAGYSYVLDTSPVTTPGTLSRGSAISTTYANVADGLQYFHVRAVDSRGNWGAASHFQVKIDATGPIVTAVASAQSGEDATVTIAASDATSGLSHIDWKITGGSSGTSLTPPAQVPLMGVGVHTVTYSGTDNAGNTTVKTIVVTIVQPETVITPVAGGTRYTTAVETSKLTFPVAGSVRNVVIATGADWPDALGGAALAGQVGGPILLTDPKTLPPAVAAEIRRLGATKAYILGGTGAVSLPVEIAIRALGVSTERLAGGNRYTTANAIARKATELRSTPYDGTMFVASGANFPDALAASPLAAAKGWPLYLSASTGLTAETLATMEVRGSRVIILGGEGAVSLFVERQLRAHFTSVTRLAGGNRYTTGLEIVKFGTGPGGAGLTWRTPALATGTGFPDALAGGVLQGRSGSVLLLTSGSALTPEVGSAITSNKAAIREIRYLGGTGAVSPAVRASVEVLVQ
ncbi:MAG: cell wall-binding repeat-containing protein [Actinomycetota bacterium]|nr:cell wall-binding repeat-containing protein [Actinomycetota bacterium]MDP3630015.1 cell wall-binding repeat-containing protein [Actinomycetota bacterium]